MARRRRAKDRFEEEEETGTDEDREVQTESEDDSRIKTLSVNQSSEKRRASFKTRFIYTWIMIFSFFPIVYIGHAALSALVFLLQIGMFKEIVDIGANRRREKELPAQQYQHWWWFMATIVWMYGKILTEHFLQLEFVRKYLMWVVPYHSFICFSMFTIGFVAFVLSLKKTHYTYQFKQLGWCIMTIFLVVVQSTFVVVNMFNGLVWFLIPAFLIVSNDVWAYMWGFFFGRTPLIKLSPKKTWEGFIGGTVMTFLTSFLLSHLLQDYQFMVCPKATGFDLQWPTCDIDPIFISQPMALPDLVANYLESIGMGAWTVWNISIFQLHCTVLALFASIVAPFGGFFASGFKRAFKIKDFSQSIPGHGGIGDRFDCQILMGVFVYVYYLSFVMPVPLSVESLFSRFLQLPNEEQAQLLAQMQLHLT